MVEQLHRLIDNGAPQPVINERIAGLMENQKRDIDRIGTDHERRIRYLERLGAWGMGGLGVISFVVILIEKFWK